MVEKNKKGDDKDPIEKVWGDIETHSRKLFALYGKTTAIQAASRANDNDWDHAKGDMERCDELITETKVTIDAYKSQFLISSLVKIKAQAQQIRSCSRNSKVLTSSSRVHMADGFS